MTSILLSTARKFSVERLEPLFSFTSVMTLPVRGVQRQEAKRYWAEDGTFDPPVQVVIDRFKRLRWGAYIHPRAGRRKHLYSNSRVVRGGVARSVDLKVPVISDL
ncbi:39S ribosomal protein L35 [Echinococcus granulosus]|uniref:39S ribosomal protein L35 n=1 Tax=Echinococcus granulosus TaxID=6210 RepID=W6UD44_ECHGR|nr:39S ribosomal protein L35 [Echinococcus granulosus]EUB59235.1 39S ribosomal protein L35 [Echinococcus granulosus]